ncbi:MAG TPA: DnaJ domain-containing protein, partial [Thermoanaerobaculia bacterium]|nr:DnaJ domain-containing protein [Thermoanaerobaculia bacterium]
MSPPPSSSHPPVLQLVRRVHRERLSGVVEVEVGEETRRLVMRRGELHLPADHPLARALAPLLAAESPRPVRPGAAGELRGIMARIAFLVRSWHGPARFLHGEGTDGAMVGPLPTRLLLMEWAAAHGAQDLSRRLGGEEAELVAVAALDRPAARTARLLDPQAAVLLSRLSRPTRVGDLLRQAGGSPARVLADLARLAEAGLIARRQEPAAAEPPAEVEPAVAPDLLRRHAERVGRDLAVRPLALDAASHRSRLAELAAEPPSTGAYRLLGLEVGASKQAIDAAYQRLARLTHPSHGGRLGIGAGDEGLLRRHFERVTAAYLTLSQPGRRSRHELEIASPVTAERPADEARQLARSYYERAEALIEAEDFHFAIELLKEAVSSHPRPEYYVLLGRVQAKNPTWLRHAVDSYRRALDLGADDGRVSVALGRLCEEMEQLDEAERHY